MDTDSDYETTPTTTPTTPIQGLSIKGLTERVEEFQRLYQLETIETLSTENSQLQHQILQYQRVWCSTIDLLEQAQQALLSLQKALEYCIQEDIAAERDWLAFWGIKKECTQRPNYSAAGWI